MMNRKLGKMSMSVNPSQRRQQGVSLIDAMIAIVIFSVGLLAVAALQTVSKQSNFEAIQRTYAASLAYDLFERMRMNKNALSSYVTSTTITDETYTPCASGCAAAAMASNDLYEWKNNLLGDAERTADGSVGGLLSPTACLSGPGTTGQYTLTIVWRGQARIANKSASTCGGGTGLYDDAAADDFAYRRILTMSSYL